MFVSTFLINTVVQSVLLLFGAHLIQHHRIKADVLLAFMLYQGQLQVSAQMPPDCILIIFLKNVRMSLSTVAHYRLLPSN